MDPGKFPAYQDYWKQRALLAAQSPHFPVITWWADEGLSESEQKIFDAVRGARHLLDVGAGDHRIRKKIERAGFSGTYHTQDVSGEHAHTFTDLSQATAGTYEAVLCLDVLEHLTLENGLALLGRMREL